ncbi:MAG: hypothetical protein ACI89D_001984 [Bermanella sp.]|jgi:hypothetical protein
MIQHLCLINFKHDLDAATQQQVIAAYNKLPALIPGITNFKCGMDRQLLEGNSHFGIVAEFESEDAFKAYSVHPAQGEVIFPVVGELMASYTTTQFSL